MNFPAISRVILAASALVFTGQTPLLAQGTGYWHTSGNRILDANNQQVRIAGLNWYGFETTDAVAHGLSSADYKAILANIQALGYNTIRIPFSNQMVETPSSNLNITYYRGFGPVNTDLQGLNSLQVLDKIIAYAGTVGLRVILDNHRSEAGNSAESNGLWYTSAYPESAWINDWTALAQRYANNPTVIGFDLRNEPHNAYTGGACWDCGSTTNDWHLAAQRAGNAVLGVNPNLLVFVEGTDAYNNDYYWWGGNLEGVGNSPVTLAVPNRLVYSAHDYGPTEYGQSWFPNDSAASLSAVWSQHWGYIAKQGLAPIWLGEFGTTNSDADIANSASGSEGLWFQSLIAYLHADSTLNWTYWAMNGEDNYGLLDSNYDPAPVSASKQNALASNQFALTSAGSTNTPAAPTSLTATASSTSQINLSWTASTTSGVTYAVSIASSPSAAATVLASGLTVTSFPATGLSPSTTYYFTIAAASSNGTSAVSNQASATTQAPPVPSAPTSLSASASSSTQINLSWTPSTTAGVTYSVYSGSSAGGVTTLAASGLTASTFQATGLSASTTYYYIVEAVAGSTASAASNTAGATTQAASTPAAPTSLTATTSSSTQINLSWTPSTSSGATYSVYTGTSAGSITTLAASGLTATSYQAPGLAASTTYFYVVQAVTSSVSSASSNTASATTQAAPVTAAPTALSATASSSSQINLTWTASSTTGATYSVYTGTSAGGVTTLVASALTGTAYASTTLSGSTTYYYLVKAVANNSTSTASNTASATTQAAAANAPAAPSGLSASPSSSSQINLNWAQSSTAGVTYSVFQGTSSSAVTSLVASGLLNTNYTATRLADGSTYYFTVKAVANSVSSAASNIASASTQTAPSTPPTNLSAISVSATEIDLTWAAVSNTGATYSVYSGTSSGATNTLVASSIPATGYAITGLNASTTYFFTVRSVSPGGTSSPSNQASATTQASGTIAPPAPPTQPSAPTTPANLSAGASSTTQINLSWSASTATNSTSTITYTLYTGASAATVSTILAQGLSGTSYAATGLTPGTTYYFAVSATNSTGSSGTSGAASATTQVSARAPGAPVGLTATATSDTLIGLSWSASSGSGITYSIYGGTSSAASNLLASGLTATSYQATGLTATTTYYFTVKAVSSAGSSPASNQASATTQATQAGGCHVAYAVQNDWGAGMTSAITITNNGKPLTSWTLTWTYPGNQQIYQSWSSNYTEQGQAVTLANAAWNGTIATGGTVSGVGFNASYSGANTNPGAFYLNGTLCQ